MPRCTDDPRPELAPYGGLRMPVRLGVLLAMVLVLGGMPRPARAETSAASAAEPRESPGQAPPAAGNPDAKQDAGDDEKDDWTHFEMPAYPGLRTRDAVRLHVQSGFAPAADLGAAEVDLYQPELRGRLTVPLSEAAVVRIAATGGISHYHLRGRDLFRFEGTSLLGDAVQAFRTRLNVQGAFRLTEPGSALLFEGEAWSLLAGLQGSSDFESGAFAEGLSGATALALGYELNGRLRAAAGVALRTSLDDGGLDVAPIGSLRWDVTEHLTVRDRGLGLQVEYRIAPRLELFASGFRASDSYRLRDVGALEDLTLQDKQVKAVAGLEWRISPHFRLNAEAGAIAWRRIRVREEDRGTLVSHTADPSAFLELRLELRP